MASRKNANASLGKTVKPNLAIGFIRNGKKTEKKECYVKAIGESLLIRQLPANHVFFRSLLCFKIKTPRPQLQTLSNHRPAISTMINRVWIIIIITNIKSYYISSCDSRNLVQKRVLVTPMLAHREVSGSSPFQD